MKHTKLFCLKKLVLFPKLSLLTALLLWFASYSLFLKSEASEWDKGSAGLPVVKVGDTNQNFHRDKNTESLKIPEGWSKQTESVLESIVSPENDLTIYFYKEKVSAGFDFSKKSLSLWKKINTSFLYKEKKKGILSSLKRLG